MKRNLAVVINKVDIPTLEEKIGETAAQQYLAENAKPVKVIWMLVMRSAVTS